MASVLTPALADDASIIVRAGGHETFDRLVFDNAAASHPSLQQNGSSVTVLFKKSADINLKSVPRAKLSRINDLKQASKTDENALLSFVIIEGSTIKLFENGTSVVVDVFSTQAPQEKKTAPVATKKETPTATKETPTAAPAAVKEKEPAPPAAEKEKPKAVEKHAELKPVAPPVTPEPAPVKTENPDHAPSPQASEIVPVQKTPLAEAPVAPTETPLPKKRPPKIEIGATPELILTLNPHTETGLAAFVRAGYGYVLFDRKITLSLAQLTEGFPAPRVELEALDLPGNSGFRFLLPSNTSLRVARNETAWTIHLSKEAGDNLISDALTAQPDFALGSRLIAYILDPPMPFRFTDPTVGDDLIISPLRQVNAFARQVRFAEAELVPAAQGLVVRPLVDTLSVNKVTDGIEVSRAGGLKLSPSSDTVLLESHAKKSEDTGKRLFAFSQWAGKKGETYSQTKQRLYQTIAEVSDAERNRARLELARFYFAQGRAHEASGVLTVLLKKNPDLKNYPDFRALSGAVKILLGRSAEGLAELDMPEIKFVPEAQLWQAVADVQMHNLAAASQKFIARRSVLANYPDPFYTQFSVLAAEALTATDHDSDAEEIISEIEDRPHNTRADPALKYIHAVIHSKAGREKIAENLWKDVSRSIDRLYKVRADLALIDLGVATKSLTPKQAADKLELLRFAWRGDELEVDILHRLGLFYFEAKNIKAGVQTLSTILRLFPETPNKDRIAMEMKQAFRNVFLDEKAALPPLEALALYQSQSAWIQADENRAMITRALAEKLVSIDLLDQAAILLEGLIKNDLTGEEKVKASTRLAGIRLLDKTPEKAIDALQMIGKDPVSETATVERQLLQARALADMKKTDEALTVIGKNDSLPARLLRIDIALRANRWDDASTNLFALVEPLSNKPSLSPEEAEWVVNCATAYAMKDDQNSLNTLDRMFANKMAATKHNDLFRLLTHSDDTGPLRTLTNVGSRIKDIDLFRRFLDSYRKDEKKGD